MTLSLIVAGMAIGDAWSPIKSTAQAPSRRKDAIPPPSLENRTNSFQIIDSKVLDKEILLTFRNESKTPANAFYLTVGPDGNAELYNVELIFSDIKTQIGTLETFQYRVSYDQNLHSEALILRAVLFTDGTSEGELKFVQEMKDTRSGMKLQLLKGLEFLEAANQSGKTNDDALAELTRKVSILETKNERESPAFNAGLAFGKDRLSQYFEVLGRRTSSSSPGFQEDQLRLKLKLETIVPKLCNTLDFLKVFQC